MLDALNVRFFFIKMNDVTCVCECGSHVRIESQKQVTETGIERYKLFFIHPSDRRNNAERLTESHRIYRLELICLSKWLDLPIPTKQSSDLLPFCHFHIMCVCVSLYSTSIQFNRTCTTWNISHTKRMNVLCVYRLLYTCQNKTQANLFQLS